MSRKPRKPYREPWVLDIHKPVLPPTTDEMLDDMMRKLWTSPEYWAEHGMRMPEEPYPGIAAVRALTHA